MKSGNFCLFAFIGFLLISCSSSETVLSDQVDQDTIYQWYNASYDQEEGQLRIQAQFRVGGSGGTTLQLVEPSQVEHSDYTLTLRNSALIGSVYETTEDVSFQKDHEWTYTNNESDVFVNQSSIPEIDISDLSVNIQKDEDLEISWEGEALSDDESVRLEIRDANGLVVSATQTNEGSTSIIMPKEDLQILESGLIKLRASRSRTRNIQENAGKGGSMSTSFSTRFSSANLVD